MYSKPFPPALEPSPALIKMLKIMKELYTIDIVVTMGCNVNCPYLPCKSREDWGLDDSISQDDAVIKKTIGIIEEKLENLAERIRQGLGS